MAATYNVPALYLFTLTARRRLALPNSVATLGEAMHCRASSLRLDGVSPYLQKGRLSARHRADNEEWFVSIRHACRQWGVGRFVREILFAGEEANKGPPLLGGMIAYRSSQHRVANLESIQNGSLSYRPLNVELNFAADLREFSQMKRKFDANHAGKKTRNSNLEIRNKHETKVKAGNLEKRPGSVISLFC